LWSKNNMKTLFKSLLIGILIGTQAHAGLPPTTIKGQSDATAKTKFGFQVPMSQSTDLGGISALIETGNQNILANPGFEGSTGWTTSGGATTAINTTAKGTGAKGYDWDSNSASQTLTSTAVTLTAGLYGKNGVASCAIKSVSSGATYKIQAYDGTNVLAEASITSSTSTFARTSVNFIFPSSGSVSLRLISVASNEPEIYVDDCYLGLAEGFNISQVSQAQFVGSSYIATTASCTWTRANTALGAFGTTAACPGPTIESSVVGSWQTTDSDLPKQTINNLPPGVYEVIVSGCGNRNSGANDYSNFTISDGTTTSGRGSGAYTGGSPSGITIVGYFNYTTSGDRSFEVYGSAASGNAVWDNAGGQCITRWQIKRFPSNAEQSYRPDQTPASWSGYHSGNDCSFATSSTTLADPAADATCTFTEQSNVNFGTVSSYLSGSDKLPGITFTPPRQGRYFVCAQLGRLTSSAGSINVTAELSDTAGPTFLSSIYQTVDTNYRGGSICGIYNATSTASKTIRLRLATDANTVTLSGVNSTSAHTVKWQIFELDAPMAAPYLTGSVTSKSTTQAYQLVTAYVTNSGTAAVSRSDGNWLTFSSDNGVGDSTFTMSGFASAPNCVCTTYIGGARSCQIDSDTALSSTAIRILTSLTTTGAGSDVDFFLMCVGPR
jgi:hypothetical protein